MAAMHDIPTFFVVTLIVCLTPGAGVLYTVSNAFRYGTRHAWRSPCGNALGCLTIGMLSALGLGGVIAASPVLFFVLQMAGVGVLVWLGWKNWTAPAVDVATLGRMRGQKLTGGAAQVVRNAALLQATNPMLFVFLLSLMPQFVTPGMTGYGWHVAVLTVLFVLICLSVHLGYSYAASLVGDKLRSKRFSWWLNHVSAVLFWLVAASVVADYAAKHL